MLQLTGITKQFREARFTLQPITLQLDKGLHLLIGPNGAGKSTLLKIIATVMPPDAGSISFNQRKVASDLYNYRLNLGYLPQAFGFYNRMTGREFLAYMAGLKGINSRSRQERIAEVTELLGLESYCSGKIATWSIGQRQRLGLAQALLNDPAFLILDEPFSGLAPQETEQTAQLLTGLSRDKVILISTHLLAGLPMTGLMLLVNGYLEYTGRPRAFLDAARGKIWSVEIAKEEWLNLKTQYPTSTVIFAGDYCRCKLISDRQPDLPGVRAATPQLEDAYSYWLRNCYARHGESRLVSEGSHGN
jgi:ABC-2 type transport system ATP-binding protein